MSGRKEPLGLCGGSWEAAQACQECVEPPWVIPLILRGSGVRCLLAGVGVSLPSVSMKEGRVGQQARLLGSREQRPPGAFVDPSTQGEDSSLRPWFGPPRDSFTSASPAPAPDKAAE